jgi:hypothetical protein
MFDLIHALCRLHNLCVRRNTPVVSKHTGLMCDPILEVDVDGRLVNDMWCSAETFECIDGLSISVSSHNTVRQSILSEITENKISLINFVSIVFF